jgi:hypothetical protein
VGLHRIRLTGQVRRVRGAGQHLMCGRSPRDCGGTHRIPNIGIKERSFRPNPKLQRNPRPNLSHLRTRRDPRPKHRRCFKQSPRQNLRRRRRLNPWRSPRLNLWLRRNRRRYLLPQAVGEATIPMHNKSERVVFVDPTEVLITMGQVLRALSLLSPPNLFPSPHPAWLSICTMEASSIRCSRTLSDWLLLPAGPQHAAFASLARLPA